MAAGPTSDVARHDQIDAAQANAVMALHDEIGRLPLAQNLTVQDFLDQTCSSDELTKTLLRAQQVGGPRWLDEQTCQIRLEISGTLVANTLSRIATIHGDKSPISSDQLQFVLRDWSGRTFAATGSSTGSKTIEDAAPIAAIDPWASVDESARRQAVVSARENAIGQVLESIRPIEWPAKKTLGELLSANNGALDHAMTNYLAARPVTAVVFQDDLSVKLTLANPAPEFFDAFRDAALAQQNLSLPTDQPSWNTLRETLIKQLAPAEGVGRLPDEKAIPHNPATMILTTPPDWVDQQIDAEGRADPSDSKLRAARHAEIDARAKLEAQIENLKLTDNQTLEQVAKANPLIRDAVVRTLRRARIYKSDYFSDGSVVVHMTLDLRDLWEELQRTP
ncbi:MAG: hypothetical protein IT447_09565 [Phycisphaerales bacterium]|nr:hypothetical protein [Phycisphaerales bacterium]